MFDKTVSTYLSTIKFVPECFMTQEMRDKAVNRCRFVFSSMPDQHKSREMCDSYFWVSFFNSILSWWI